MKLMSGERVLEKYGSLKVTTHRVRYDRQGGGQGTIISIMHEEVASCSVIRLTYPLFLIFGGLCVIGGLFATLKAANNDYVMGGILFGLFFVVAYVLTRKQAVAIASAGDTIFLDTSSWTLAEIRELLDQVEMAKNARRSSMRRVKMIP